MAKHLSRPFVAQNDKSRLENILESCGIPEEQRLKLLTAIRAEKENLAAIAFGGLPPHAPELEEAILGAILSSSRDHRTGQKGPAPVLHTIRTYLPKPAFFYLETNQTIYRTILAMDAEQLQIDELTVVQYMRQNKTLAAVGGAARISELSQKIAPAAHIETWSRFIFELFQERELIHVCAASIKNLYDHKGDVFDIANSLNRASRINSPNSLLNSSLMDDAIIAGAQESPKRRIIGDLIREREVSILFSDEKTGKTALAIQFAIAAAKGTNLFERADLFPNECAPMKVQIFDFEMENRELYDRYSDAQTGEMYLFGENLIRTVLNPDCYDLRAAPERMIAAVEAEIEKHQPQFVIIDNITWIVKENKDADIAADFMAKMLQLQRKHGLSVVVIAHTPKRNTSELLQSKDLQGSKNLVNFCKNLIGVAASRKDKPIRYIKHIFSRNGPVLYDENNVIECSLDKEPGSALLRWNLIGFTKEIEHLTVPEQTVSEDELMEGIFHRHNKNMSLENIRKDMNLGWSKWTISRKLAAWKEKRGFGTLPFEDLDVN